MHPVFVQYDISEWTQHMAMASLKYLSNFRCRNQTLTSAKGVRGLNSSTDPKGSWVLIRIQSSLQHQWAVTRPHPRTKPANRPPDDAFFQDAEASAHPCPWRRRLRGDERAWKLASLALACMHASCFSHTDPSTVSLIGPDFSAMDLDGWKWAPLLFAGGLMKSWQDLQSKQCPIILKITLQMSCANSCLKAVGSYDLFQLEL